MKVWGRVAMTTTANPIVPVWLNVDDLDVVENCLKDYLSAHELEPELEEHVARLAKHFDWVRGEFLEQQG
jgi:hypothetical protein